MAWITLERVDEPGTLYATGGAKTVWVNYRQGTSVALPQTVRGVIAPE
jgi:acyl-CoA thioester hydrolase